MNIKAFLYADGTDFIVIRTKRKPSEETQSRSGTWVCREWDKDNNAWLMPACPEVTLRTLQKMKYLGVLKEDKP